MVFNQLKSLFLVIVALLCIEGILCIKSYAVIDKTNCINNTTWAVNTRQSTVEFTAVFSSSILSKNCLVYVSNDDFQANKVYEVLVEIDGNFSMYHDFSAGIYVGHPESNQPIQILTSRTRKWYRQLPSWDVYVSMASNMVAEFNVSVTIQECRGQFCYQLVTPSIIPTHIINVPNQCFSNYCLENYAVSYHIRTSFFHHKSCSLHFAVKNYPSICITIGDHWKDNIIRSTKCRTITIKIGNVLYATFDRLIFKPWCLPWIFKNNSVSLTWEDDSGVSGQNLCTVTIFTNTSNHGEACYSPTTQASKNEQTEDNTEMMTAITVVSLTIMLILATVIVYFIIKRGRLSEADQQFVTNYHHHSSVQVISPPPYSIAIQDTAPSYTCRTSSINPTQQFEMTHVLSDSSQSEQNATTGVLRSPPPYSEISQ